MPKSPKEKKKHSYSPYPDREETKGKSQPPPPFSLISSSLSDKKDSQNFSKLSFIDFDDDIDYEVKENTEKKRKDLQIEENTKKKKKNELKIEEKEETKKTILNFDDVEEYINENGIIFNISSSDLVEMIDEANRDPREISLERFCECIPTLKEVESFDGACEDELKGKLVSRIAAPNWVRDSVYQLDKKKHYLEKNKDGLDQFKCMYCKDPVVVDKKGKEVGFETSNSKSKRQPPVCHGKTFPAAYVRDGINDLLTRKKLDPSNLRFCGSTNKLVQQLVWIIGLPEMMPGHTKCNVGDKDERYSELSEKSKNTLLQKLENFLSKNNENGEVKDTKSPSYLDVIMQDLRNFSLKSELQDEDEKDKKPKQVVDVSNYGGRHTRGFLKENKIEFKPTSLDDFSNGKGDKKSDSRKKLKTEEKDN